MKEIRVPVGYRCALIQQNQENLKGRLVPELVTGYGDSPKEVVESLSRKYLKLSTELSEIAEKMH